MLLLLMTPPPLLLLPPPSQGNIASADLVSYVLRKERIDTIMHFAAQTHVDNSFGNRYIATRCFHRHPPRLLSTHARTMIYSASL